MIPRTSRALPLAELRMLIQRVGVNNPHSAFCKIETEIEQWLARSFPATPADADRIRRMVREDVEQDRLGIGVHRQGEQLHLALPVVALVGQRQ